MSTIFEFTKEISDDFHQLATEIENLIYEQPNATLMKSRLYCEHIVKRISEQEKLEEMYPLKHAERIYKLYRDQAIEEEIYLKLEWIRKMGNKAAHHLNAVDIQSAIQAHRFLFDISVWYMEVYVSYDFVAPIYQLPRRQSGPSDADQLIQPYVEQTMEKIDSLWQEVNEKIESINKEKQQAEVYQAQNIVEKEKIPFPILAYLREQELEYVDKRDQDGVLWILGDWSINEKLTSLKKHKMYFRFTKKGGKSTNYQSAWFLLNKTLPLVEIDKIGVKQSDTVEWSDTIQEKKEEDQLLTIVSVESDYWIDRGQIQIPRHLEHERLPEDSSNGIAYLKKHWNLSRFNEVTEDALREIYQQSRFHFFNLLEELYVQGFRFTGVLSRFHNGPTVENDLQIQVNNFTASLESFFSAQFHERLKKYHINTIKELDKRLLSTMAWILKEDIGQVKILLEGITFDKSDREEEKEEELFTLHFEEEMLKIPGNLAETLFNDMDIQGCNHMLTKLQEKGIYRLSEMPTYLDGIHRQLKGVGEGTVIKFWQELQRLDKIETAANTPPDGELVIRYEQNVVTIPSEIKNKKMKSEWFPANVFSTLETMQEEGIILLSDLPVDLLQLKDLPGIGKVRIKNLFHSLEEVVSQIFKEEKINKLTNEELLDYELKRYVEWYQKIKESDKEQKKFKIPKQYITLVQKRYQASLEGEHITLEQLGSKHGVTRERIRQILKKGDRILLDNWERLVSVLTHDLSAGKEMIPARELDDKLEAHFLLIHALDANGIFYQNINEIAVLSMKNKRQLEEYVETVKRDMQKVFSKRVITLVDVDVFCKERALEDGSPEEVVYTIATTEINWLSENQGIIKNMTKADIVEMVMLQYPNGVEIYQREEELIEKANALMPGGFHGERSFYSIVIRDDLQDTFYMWGRGTYIHVNFVLVDETWLDSVITTAESWHKEEEFFHIRKLFNAVKKEAFEQGVPNEYALYSLIRIFPQQKLSLPRFPTVLPYGADRLENHEWVTKFLKERARPVAVRELMEEFVHQKGWREFTLTSILWGSTKIIPYDHGVYTLVSQYEDIESEDIQFIISKLKMAMNKRQFIYFPSFFNENEMYLKSIGIPTAYVLYGLLKNMGLSTFKFPRFPYAVLEEFEGDTLTIKDLVEGLILEENRIVAREEVNFWLTELLGEGSRILDLVLLRSNNLLYYSRGQFGEYVHRDTIQMDEEKVQTILDITSAKFEEIKHQFNRKYVYISELFNPTELPTLPESIRWNEDLLGDILRKSGAWKILGSFYAVLSPLDGGIPDEVTFIETILQQQFDGAAKLTEIRSFLESVKYSKDGQFLSDVHDAIDKEKTPYVIEGDELIHKSLLEGGRLE
ncbi:DUF4145 domain-containing protein [Virgibacillus sp. MSJ-26]|uniref:DUF4145 domain-containing protein n=1 Tax=Virgibacillus sp. MSJ-26 TaxID=2841522 RepID=UPI001C11BB9B|nr:DUF4145 domain-containing protein [Virgibacillus sp. MSJ-26]MBU5465814.1 DUF4145 domain-containing protein [Virgibacillus sp. MSJ-26]